MGRLREFRGFREVQGSANSATPMPRCMRSASHSALLRDGERAGCCRGCGYVGRDPVHVKGLSVDDSLQGLAKNGRPSLRQSCSQEQNQQGFTSPGTPLPPESLPPSLPCPSLTAPAACGAPPARVPAPPPAGAAPRLRAHAPPGRAQQPPCGSQ